ncbi:MAG: prenyltransferase [Bacteroidetes bacterium HGW-Bacteroidetes-21]|nr:MAG: prenyltransferase [Bacteroidetes bacterium HGW-Bacteroidetes-21]
MNNTLSNIFKLIRYKNLIMIILTQYFMRYLIIVPLLKVINLEPQFSNLNFMLLVLATTLIAAAGYAINDYFDRKVDLVNHPDSVLVGTKIPRRMAMTLNNTFNAISILAAFYISWRIGHFNMGFIFVLITGILWFYSATYKKWFLVGNLIVAVFSALVPFFVLLYEIPLLNNLTTIGENEVGIISLIFIYITGYSFFAFMTTLSREIIKDIEDIEGDRSYGRKTMPVVTGIKFTKSIVIAINTFIAAAVIYVSWFFFGDWISLTYSILFIAIPFLVTVYLLIRARENKDYRLIGNFIKVIMLSGLCYGILIPFLI